MLLHTAAAFTPSVAIAYGDGIGPEIMEAALMVLREAGVNITVETVSMGERMYAQGSDTGILPSAWETLRRTKVLLKAPTVLPPIGLQSVENALAERFSLCGKVHESCTLEHVTSVPQALEAIGLLGSEFAFFAPLHGDASRLAGKNTANPSGMLHAAVMMLYHLGQQEPAARIRSAWLMSIQDGLHTVDMHGRKNGRSLGTQEFAAAVVDRLWRTSGPTRNISL